MVLGVCGCVAQQEGDRILQRAPYVDLVLGPRATGSLPAALARIREAGARSAPPEVDLEYRDDSIRFPFDRIRREGAQASKAYVTVVEGCNHRCTFCVVPRTRGPEICREMPELLAEVAALAGQGTREVEFLGQTVNAYRDSSGNMLGDLLRAAAQIPGIDRIRFVTSHPAQMTSTLMDAMAAASPRVCPYLHLPVQSGSSGVLRSMKRGYDREGYLRKIEGLRNRIPELSLGTDVIVGFPTESDSDFESTLSLLREVEFDLVYSFTYSPRPGTGAEALGDLVPDPVKFERLAQVQELQRTVQLRRYARWVGRSVAVLVEGPSKRDETLWTGRTPENRIVNFPGATAPGRLEQVRVVGSSAYVLRGEIELSVA
jgi:tRNA-2-methylthio-N6-dimethylallyladenosine synthase